MKFFLFFLILVSTCFYFCSKQELQDGSSDDNDIPVSGIDVQDHPILTDADFIAQKQAMLNFCDSLFYENRDIFHNDTTLFDTIIESTDLQNTLNSYGFENVTSIMGNIALIDTLGALLQNRYPDIAELSQSEKIELIALMGELDENGDLPEEDCCPAYKKALKECLMNAIFAVASAWVAEWGWGASVGIAMNGVDNANRCIREAEKNHADCCPK